MWTEQTRARQAKRTAPRKRYPSALTDAEWEFIAPLLPKPALRGRHRITDLREVLNAIRYLVRSGCEWRILPTHFPPWQTVYWWFRRLVRSFLFQIIHEVTLMLDRQAQGRDAQPTAAMIDSQTVKAPRAARRGYDAAKRINGRKRHIVVEVVRRLAGQQGIEPLPRRWVVERTFGWMMQWRRLVRDYEMRLDVSTTMMHVALGSLLLQRLLIPG